MVTKYDLWLVTICFALALGNLFLVMMDYPELSWAVVCAAVLVWCGLFLNKQYKLFRENK